MASDLPQSEQKSFEPLCPEQDNHSEQLSSTIDEAKEVYDESTYTKTEAPADNDSAVSTPLSPFSSPLSCPFSPNVDFEPLSPLSSPATCVTSLPEVSAASDSPVPEEPALEEKVQSRQTSPIPGPSKLRLVSVERNITPEVTQIPGPSTKTTQTEEIVKPEVAKDSKKKRPRRSSLDGQCLSSSLPSRSSSPTPRPRKKKVKRSAEDAGECHAEGNESTNVDSSTGTCQANPTPRTSPAPRAEDPIADMQEDEDDSSYASARNEMHGCLIQAMALSRASSMPASTLVKVVLRENAHLIGQRGKDSWLEIIQDVLQSHDIFGRIDRQGLVSKLIMRMHYVCVYKDD